MKLNNSLSQLKKDYLSTIPTRHLRITGRQELLNKIDQSTTHVLLDRFKYAFLTLFILVVGLALIRLSSVVKASTPGTFLYPIKQASEELINRVKEEKQEFMDQKNSDNSFGGTPEREDRQEDIKGETDEKGETEVSTDSTENEKAENEEEEDYETEIKYLNEDRLQETPGGIEIENEETPVYESLQAFPTETPESHEDEE